MSKRLYRKVSTPYFSRKAVTVGNLTEKDIKKLEKLLQEVSDIVGNNVEFGKDVEVDGNLTVNDENSIINKTTGKPLLTFKTIFGEQNILGSGNIDLFNHFITLNGKWYVNLQSSNNLKCDSPGDLALITKATNGTKIAVADTYIVYNNLIWQTADGTNITTVTDSVTSV